MTTAIVLRRPLMKQQFERERCFHCGRPTFKPWDGEAAGKSWPWINTRDHIIPISVIPKEKRGCGALITVPSCVRCNFKKGRKMPSPQVVQRAVNFLRMKSKSMRRQKWYLG
jgi:hypothetical protein